ncbi:MAG TPA: hypothetical protein VGM82_08570 [Gemmatimonadaceae bacterium]|jgi:hypothetical protein
MSNSSHSRRALFVMGALAATTPLAAQNGSAADLGTIAIAVVVPKSNTMLTVEQKNQIGNTLLQAVTATGISAMGSLSRFELTPLVTVTKDGEAGELKKIHYVTLNVTLAVRQASNNLTFSSTSLVIDGTASNKDGAITEAINNISPSDERIVKLVETAKPKIIQYYESSCAAIRSDAKTRARTGHSDEAIALLLSVPREATTCQKAAGADAEVVYASYRDAVCEGLVREARAALSNREFETAKQKAEAVDPASRCGKEADDVLRDLEKKTTSDHEFSLGVHASIRERERVSSSPGEAAKQTHERVVGVAVEVVAKLPTKPHIIDNH